MSDFARRMLSEQRKRLVGGLMQYLEERVYPLIPEAERAPLRAKVLAASAAYHDVCLDILKAVVPDEDMVSNEETLVLLRSIHQAVHDGRVHDGRP